MVIDGERSDPQTVSLYEFAVYFERQLGYIQQAKETAAAERTLHDRVPAPTLRALSLTPVEIVFELGPETQAAFHFVTVKSVRKKRLLGNVSLASACLEYGWSFCLPSHTRTLSKFTPLRPLSSFSFFFFALPGRGFNGDCVEGGVEGNAASPLQERNSEVSTGRALVLLVWWHD